MDKKELCEICKLNKNCQHNFDYRCQEVFDFFIIYFWIDVRNRFDKLGKYKTKSSYFNALDDNDDYICDICKQKRENELNYIPKDNNNILIICDNCMYKPLQEKGLNVNKIKEINQKT